MACHDCWQFLVEGHAGEIRDEDFPCFNIAYQALEGTAYIMVNDGILHHFVCNCTSTKSAWATNLCPQKSFQTSVESTGAISFGSGYSMACTWLQIRRIQALTRKTLHRNTSWRDSCNFCLPDLHPMRCLTPSNKNTTKGKQCKHRQEKSNAIQDRKDCALIPFLWKQFVGV